MPIFIINRIFKKKKKTSESGCRFLKRDLLSLFAVSQVPGGLHLRQQREAAGRRSVPFQPEDQKVVHRVQHADERVLGPRTDPLRDALQARGRLRAHHPHPPRPVQGERRADQSGVREESARQSLTVQCKSNWCPAMCCFPCVFRWL